MVSHPAAEADPGNHADAADAAALEAGRLLFARPCRFVQGAAGKEQLPAGGLPEVAFAGRSNVGKSSLINVLTGRTRLAATSVTPGRTRQLNFFSLDDRLMLVDLPGYGYAQAPKTEVACWTRLVQDYLTGRPVLRRVLVLIEARHGMKDVDARVMTLLDRAAVSYQVVLTKCDKITAAALPDLLADVASHLAGHTAAHPTLLPTSARLETGIAAVRAELARLAQWQAEPAEPSSG